MKRKKIQQTKAPFFPLSFGEQNNKELMKLKLRDVPSGLIGPGSRSCLLITEVARVGVAKAWKCWLTRSSRKVAFAKVI